MEKIYSIPGGALLTNITVLLTCSQKFSFSEFPSVFSSPFLVLDLPISITFSNPRDLCNPPIKSDTSPIYSIPGHSSTLVARTVWVP